MFDHAPDSLFRLYASLYVPMTWSDQQFRAEREANPELQLAAAAATSARTGFSPLGAGILAAVALVILGSIGVIGV
jgi:hypothetical protein